jgi:hypothetical protein
MFGSFFSIMESAVKIVVAPVEIVATVVAVPLKAVADAAEELVDDVKDGLS